MYSAMILAAGRGERMRPLTDTLPKPLLRAGGKMLIEYHLEKLAQAGFTAVVINHAYLGKMIEAKLGNGERYGIPIHYSAEQSVLETAGGIAKALPLLTDATRKRPFLVINADIFCQLEYATLQPILRCMQSDCLHTLAHLVLVNNPPQNPEGDFFWNSDLNKLAASAHPGCLKLTFSGIGIYHPALFKKVLSGQAEKLAPLLRTAIAAGKVNGSHYSGIWMDIGTPERLYFLNAMLQENHSNRAEN
jgi:N-acetyl-alpha-D-muramate 1-phosphate uridylyltransferase